MSKAAICPKAQQVTTSGSDLAEEEEWPGRKPPAQPSADAGDDRMKNPLGARALYLNADNRIHGTSASLTIGHGTTDGCIFVRSGCEGRERSIIGGFASLVPRPANGLNRRRLSHGRITPEASFS